MTPPRNPAERKAAGAALARDHRVTVRESRTILADVYAHANWRTRTITVPSDWYQTDAGFAAFVHELGHVLAGPCPQQEPHRRDPAVRAWWNCVACETEAWTIAMRLCPEFSRRMFEAVKTWLGHYRRQTPASRGAVVAAKRLASDSRYAHVMQERVARDIRLSQHEEHRRLAAEPRRLRRWEVQLQEIRDIAKGV